MATVEERLMTLDEYARMPNEGRRTELVRGRMVELPPTNYWHGIVCGLIARRVGNWAEDRNLGRVATNDSGIVTERNPDTLRGADVAYYSYAKIPKGSHPAKYPDVPPEVVFEVLSPSDRWRDIRIKVAEYLALGIQIVCVIDPETRTAWIYATDQPDRIVGPEGDLTFPECLPEFSVPIRSLFE